LPDNILVQAFERVHQDEVKGRVFVYVDGCLKPKHDWKLMPHDGYLYWSGYLDQAKNAYIDDLLVDEQYRRRGLGAILVEQVEKRMRVFGVTHIKGIAKEEAESFWERQGYKLDRETSWFLKTLGTMKLHMEQQYSQAQIKQMARQQGVSTAGTKRDIIKRLL